MRRLVCVLVFVSLLTGVVAGQSQSKQPRGNVTITFDGLMALAMGWSDRVSVGILDVPHHSPQLTITRIKGSQRQTVATLGAEDLRGNLSIYLEGAESAVSRYLPSPSMTDPADFRWNIDMETDLFQKQLYIQEGKLWGKIHISHGEFYSRNLSGERYRFASRDGKLLSFDRRVGEPAAALDLQSGQVLTISGNGDSWRLQAAGGIRYEIAITNEPPASMANMDHFLFYYGILGEKVTPYQPVMMEKVYFPPPMMCGAVVFGRSSLD